MGPSRATRDEQYRYLLNMATRFQAITAFALKADYGSDEVFDCHPSLRLATAVVDRNDMFSEDMYEWGHTKTFKLEVEPEPEPVEIATDAESANPALKTSIESESSRRRRSPFDELEGILAEPTRMTAPDSKAIIPWLTNMYTTSRGFELGTFDASLLPIIWKKQSINWDALSLGYLSDIVDIVHTFSMQLLSVLCDDNRLLREISATLLDAMLERYKKAMDHTRFLLEVEKEGTPLTTNHYFAENLEKTRQDRVKRRLEKHSYRDSNRRLVVNLDTTIATTTASNLEHTVEDLHDILQAYYKVARKRFVDVVCMQAADYHLMTGPDTPIKVFSPSFVSELTDEQLRTIAGEEPLALRKREQLKRDIENLEKGMKVLR